MKSTYVALSFGLTPRDFKIVADLLDSIHSPDSLLGHLLLKERIHRAPQRDAAIFSVKS